MRIIFRNKILTHFLEPVSGYCESMTADIACYASCMGEH